MLRRKIFNISCSVGGHGKRLNKFDMHANYSDTSFVLRCVLDLTSDHKSLSLSKGRKSLLRSDTKSVQAFILGRIDLYHTSAFPRSNSVIEFSSLFSEILLANLRSSTFSTKAFTLNEFLSPEKLTLH